MEPRLYLSQNAMTTKETCDGYNYTVHAGSLQKVHDDYDEDIGKIKAFIRIAKKVLHGI